MFHFDILEERIRSETKHSILLKKLLRESKLHSMIRSYPPSFIPDTVPYPFLPSSISENSLLPFKPVKKVHAVLCPLSHQAPPIYMHNNILNVGTGKLSWIICSFNDIIETMISIFSHISESKSVKPILSFVLMRILGGYFHLYFVVKMSLYSSIVW